MTVQSYRFRGRDNVTHICPACWRPAERITQASSVKCAAGHISCMRCGRAQCACSLVERPSLSASA